MVFPNLILCLVFLGPQEAAELTTSELAKGGEKYNDKVVQVKGEVTEVRKGDQNQYTALKVSDGKTEVNVYTRSNVEVKVGDKVTVKGRYLHRVMTPIGVRDEVRVTPQNGFVRVEKREENRVKPDKKGDKP